MPLLAHRAECGCLKLLKTNSWELNRNGNKNHSAVAQDRQTAEGLTLAVQLSHQRIRKYFSRISSTYAPPHLLSPRILHQMRLSITSLGPADSSERNKNGIKNRLAV